MPFELSLKTREIINAIAAYNGMKPEWYLVTPEIRKVCKPLLDSLTELFASLKGREGLSILIHGDYDVDGITSGVMLERVFGAYFTNPKITLHLPLRDSGYGVTPDSIIKINEVDPDVILTVDCGTNDKLVFEHAAAHPEKTYIILDHHLITQKHTLPENVKLINIHNFKGLELCSAGISFFVARALIGDDVFQSDYIGLAALGTVADLVNLNNPVNFTLVKMGITYLNQRQPEWAVHLNTKPDFSAYTLGFYLAPRINACSRMGLDTMIASRALKGDLDAINTLQAANTQRQMQVESVMEQISPNLLQLTGEVVFYEVDTKPGFAGLVASKAVELTQKPALIATKNASGHMSGSGRSMKGIHLVNDVMTEVAPLFLRYGGHEQAGGFSYECGNAEKIAEIIATLKVLHKRQNEDGLVIEIPFEAEYLESAAVANYLTEPHGMGNAAPRFVVSGAMIKNIFPIKNGMYSKIQIACSAKPNVTLSAAFWQSVDDVKTALTPIMYSDGAQNLMVRFQTTYDPNSQYRISCTLSEIIDGGSKEVLFSQRLVKQQRFSKPA